MITVAYIYIYLIINHGLACIYIYYNNHEFLVKNSHEFCPFATIVRLFKEYLLKIIHILILNAIIYLIFDQMQSNLNGY